MQGKVKPFKNIAMKEDSISNSNSDYHERRIKLLEDKELDLSNNTEENKENNQEENLDNNSEVLDNEENEENKDNNQELDDVSKKLKELEEREKRLIESEKQSEEKLAKILEAQNAILLARQKEEEERAKKLKEDQERQDKEEEERAKNRGSKNKNIIKEALKAINEGDVSYANEILEDFDDDVYIPKNLERQIKELNSKLEKSEQENVKYRQEQQQKQVLDIHNKYSKENKEIFEDEGLVLILNNHMKKIAESGEATTIEDLYSKAVSYVNSKYVPSKSNTSTDDENEAKRKAAKDKILHQKANTRVPPKKKDDDEDDIDYASLWRKARFGNIT